MTLDDLPLASPEEVAMARGEGVSDGGLSEVFAGLTGLSRGGGEGTADVKHRPLEEVFVREGEAGGMGGSGVLKLKGFVQEDFGVVFDEVKSPFTTTTSICFERGRGVAGISFLCFKLPDFSNAMFQRV